MNYQPNRRSLKTHRVPEWYHDAKLGIFVHWSASAVPAYAPVGRGSSHEIIQNEGWEASFRYTPYAEWYINSIKIPGTPAFMHHNKKYGNDYDYDNFILEFNNEMLKWNPDDWAELFKTARAGYVVFVTKHMDGFLLWPSRHVNPWKPEYRAVRDAVSELTSAVKSRGMKMGFYYSSMLDYTFDDRPITDVTDLLTSGSAEKEYADYVLSHWLELIDRHSPDILWGDIAFPPGLDPNQLFAYYYNANPEGVVNDRWLRISKTGRRLIRSRAGRVITSIAAEIMVKSGVTMMPGRGHSDFITPEYSTFKKIKKKKWECVRGIGKSFGYNAEEKEGSYLSVKELVHLLADVVSKNGNLLLNVGPMSDGTIPEVQRSRLLGLGAWLEVNGSAIFGTRPWVRAEGITEDGIGVRFTRKGNIVYAIFLDQPRGLFVTIKDLRLKESAVVKLLNNSEPLKWRQDGGSVRIILPAAIPETPACVFSIEE